MKISFKENDPNKVLKSITDALGGRELGKMVDMRFEGKDLVVTISKLGTSTLVFSNKAAKDGLQYELTTEKIAFAHRAFKDDVKEKLFKVITGAGGKVQDA